MTTPFAVALCQKPDAFAVSGAWEYEGPTYSTVRPALSGGVHGTDEPTIATDPGEEAEEDQEAKWYQLDGLPVRKSRVVKRANPEVPGKKGEEAYDHHYAGSLAVDDSAPYWCGSIDPD